MRPINFSAVPYRTWYGRALRLPLKLIPTGLALPILQGPRLRGRCGLSAQATTAAGSAATSFGSACS
jgi:hypothetical protein